MTRSPHQLELVQKQSHHSCRDLHILFSSFSNLLDRRLQSHDLPHSRILTLVLPEVTSEFSELFKPALALQSSTETACGTESSRLGTRLARSRRVRCARCARQNRLSDKSGTKVGRLPGGCTGRMAQGLGLRLTEESKRRHSQVAENFSSRSPTPNPFAPPCILRSAVPLSSAGWCACRAIRAPGSHKTELNFSNQSAGPCVTVSG